MGTTRSLRAIWISNRLMYCISHLHINSLDIFAKSYSFLKRLFEKKNENMHTYKAYLASCGGKGIIGEGTMECVPSISI